ncbi:MAG: FAD-binding oxidoreductase, partial [Acidobacteriota bacterium]
AFRAPSPAELPELGPTDVSQDPLDRLRHARGQALPDLVRLRTGTVARLPDAVARPRAADEIEALLAAASEAGVRVVPWGGGTSVTGGVTPPPGDAPVLTLDLERLAGLHALDEVSGLATFGAGTLGPALEAALADAYGGRGATLGHFPQSFELSTLGGWIAAASSGQESLGNGRVADLVAGVSAVAPAGRIEIPPLPPSAGGPDLRRLWVGSEGRFGVIHRAAVRVRPRPETLRVEAVLMRGFEPALDGVRRLVREGVPLALLRLSDEPETQVAMTVGLAKSRFGALARGWLALRGVAHDAALLLLGAAGDEAEVEETLERARSVLRPLAPVWLGASPGRTWQRDRFRHPYLRDALLDDGVSTETLETAAPWSRLVPVADAVRAALRAGRADDEHELPVLCHLSHAYLDGASLYFTYFWRTPADADAAVERWADLKRRASDAIAAVGAATSHHHGVGSYHAPWLEAEIGAGGLRTLDAVARAHDPRGVLSPHVLLDPVDRLGAQ